MMEREDAIDVLVGAFTALHEEERGNLLYHHDKGTRILCGTKSGYFELKGAG